MVGTNDTESRWRSGAFFLRASWKKKHAKNSVRVSSPAIWWKNCARRGKSIKLRTMIVLDGLFIFSYGPHPNTHGGGVWPFCSKVYLYGEKIVHLGVKAPKFGVVIVLKLLNRIGYGPRRISARGRILHLGGWGRCNFQRNYCNLREGCTVNPNLPY